MSFRIYLDANAGATLRPEAGEACRRLLGSPVANPSSIHFGGREARRLVTEAREQLSLLLSCGETEALDIVFTSGGTEGANMLVHGFVPSTAGQHVVCSAIEHPAVREPVRALEESGCAVTWVNPGPEGIVAAQEIVDAVERDTFLVALMTAQNETGALQPVVSVARALRARGFSGPIVSDFTQAVGKSRLSVTDLFDAGIDAISVSGHKIGALSGIGAVAFNSTQCHNFSPIIRGGPQEGKLRGGTENLFGIVSFGAVAKSLLPRLDEEIDRARSLRGEFWKRVSDRLPDITCLTPPDSIANTLLLHIDGCRGDDLVVALDLLGVAASAGAACSSGKQEPSAAVLAMTGDTRIAREVVRISVDWKTTEEEIALGAECFIDAVERMRPAHESKQAAV